MEFIQIDEKQVFYLEHNPNSRSGCLVFIHGSGGDHTRWQKQMDSLPPGFRGLALDLPGHAFSPGPALQSIDDSCKLLSAILQSLELPHPLILVGHSMGSAICMLMALKYRQLIDAVVLVGSGSRLRVVPEVLESLRQGKMNPEFTRLAFSPSAPREMVDAMVAQAAQTDPSVLYSDFFACDKFDIGNDLPAINIPAFIISGQDDNLTPVKYARFLHDHIKDSQLLIIPEAGHFVMIEKGDLVNQTIQEFVSSL